MTTKILPSLANGFETECVQIHDSSGKFSEMNHSLLATRSQLERRQIRETYKAMYGEDLINILHKSNNEEPKLSAALSMWMLDLHERDAISAREALQGDDTNYRVLVEIFVGRKSSHIELMKRAYNSRFRRNLDQDIIKIEPPHPYQMILVALATSHKAHHVDVSRHVAKCDARRLFDTGVREGSGAIEEAVLLEIICKRSIPQLKLTFSSYKHIYGHDYTKVLKVGNSREFVAALKVVLKCMCNPPNYYAKTLYASINGTSADKGALSRIMVNRAEVDMDEIRKVFKRKYGKELRDAISESISSRGYKDFLVALANITTSSPKF
ncbi:hypothetical protein ACFE04_027507 [Oxalis oulophora]